MNDQQKACLQRGVIVLPEQIDHEAYLYILEAVLELDGKRGKVFCHGTGGATTSAFAICDLFSENENLIGILIGDARSSMSYIFCSCYRRYVYPNATLGIHRPSYNSDRWMDGRGFDNLTEELRMTEQRMISLYTRASNRDAVYWRELLNRAGGDFLLHLDAEQCIELGLARPFGELKEMEMSQNHLVMSDQI